MTVTLQSSANRLYTLYSSPQVTSAGGASGVWTPVPGQTDVPGTGALLTLSDSDAVPAKFYRVGVRLP